MIPTRNKGLLTTIYSKTNDLEVTGYCDFKLAKFKYGKKVYFGVRLDVNKRCDFKLAKCKDGKKVYFGVRLYVNKRAYLVDES